MESRKCLLVGSHILPERMIQHRRVVFSPGEVLNDLIDRMPAVLNSVSLPQTSAVPPQSCREFRSPDLMKAVFWRGTLPVSAQYSHKPNSQIPTPSYHLMHLMLVCSHRSSEGWQQDLSFQPVACGILCVQCKGMSFLGHNIGSLEVQTNFPLLTFMHFGALSLLLPPVIPYENTTMSGTLEEERWVLWNSCD